MACGALPRILAMGCELAWHPQQATLQVGPGSHPTLGKPSFQPAAACSGVQVTRPGWPVSREACGRGCVPPWLTFSVELFCSGLVPQTAHGP